eukprot:12900907-Prorocentrum_lima.AAC.1
MVPGGPGQSFPRRGRAGVPHRRGGRNPRTERPPGCCRQGSQSGEAMRSSTPPEDPETKRHAPTPGRGAQG